NMEFGSSWTEDTFFICDVVKHLCLYKHLDTLGKLDLLIAAINMFIVHSMLKSISIGSMKIRCKLTPRGSDPPHHRTRDLEKTNQLTLRFSTNGAISGCPPEHSFQLFRGRIICEWLFSRRSP